MAVPVKTFDKAIERLIEAGAVVRLKRRLTVADSPRVSEDRHPLTARGDLEEEPARIPWREQLTQELRRPAFVAGIIVGVGAALLTQLLGRLLFGPS